MIVVDASLVVEWLLGTSVGRQIQFRHMLPKQRVLCAPHLLDIEVANALRLLQRGGDVSADRAHEALIDLRDAPIERFPHAFLLPRVWELRDNVTAYDALYLALAEVLPAKLITLDARMVRTPNVDADIELLTDMS